MVTGPGKRKGSKERKARQEIGRMFVNKRAKITVDEISNKIIGAAIEVHRILGPRLLESIYL